jgi:hypothetical protein
VERLEVAGTGQARRRLRKGRYVGRTEVGLAGAGSTDETGWCGACGWSRKPSPGGPGRPSGSHYGEPALEGRHGRNAGREILRIARFIGNGSGTETAAKAARTGVSLSAPWSAAGRVRGCRPLTTLGRTPPALKVRCLRQRRITF